MTTVQEAGINKTVTFTRYVRVVLPLDGYVFWVRADLLTPSALYNGPYPFGTVAFAARGKVFTPAQTWDVKGALHYSRDGTQLEDENVAVDQVLFTSTREVEQLDDVQPDHVWIATLDDTGRRFAFQAQGLFFRDARIWHYSGQAIPPAMETQIIDDPRALQNTQIVSNSLPIWLSLNNYAPFYGINIKPPLYSSFLVPENLRAPYVSVHIFPESTEGIAMAPTFSGDLSQEQLCKERVRLTLYGLDNYNALGFAAFVDQYTIDNDVMGIMNVPVMRDEKRTHPELGILAKKKTIEYEVNYYQQAARKLATQLLKEALVTYVVNDKF